MGWSTAILSVFFFVSSAYGGGTDKFAIVRPFAPIDAHLISTSFDAWNDFMPCEEGATPPNKEAPDLILSYSQDASPSTPIFKTILAPLLARFSNRTLGAWTRCFRNMEVIDNRAMDPHDDVYLPSHQHDNPLWVNGPNRQFEAIASYMEAQAYDTWLLMEMDAIPRKPFFLDRLVKEIEGYMPPSFAILGSVYRGDRWDFLLPILHPALLHHVNGNAVYNSKHPVMQWLLRQLKAEATTVHNRVPFDYRISEILHEAVENTAPDAGRPRNGTFARLYQELASNASLATVYSGTSRVIGNYAKTNMIESFFGNEAIVHGVALPLFTPRDVKSKPLGLMVSDWGGGDKESDFRRFYDSGLFSEILFIVPTTTTVFPNVTRGAVKFIQRNPQLFASDMCSVDLRHFSHSVKEFIITDTFHQVLPSPYLLEMENRSLVNYIRYASPYCQKFEVSCVKSVDRANALKFNSLYFHVNPSSMIFSVDKMPFFCNAWFLSHSYQEPRDNCGNFIGPTADDYIAFYGKEALDGSLYFQDSEERGSRELFTYSSPPPLRHGKCSNSMFSWSFSHFEQKTKNEITQCLQNIAEESCHPPCLWRPKMQWCVLSHHGATRQNSASGVFSALGPLSTAFPLPDNCSSSGINDASLIAVIATLAALLLCFSIVCCVFLGGLGILVCRRRQTFVEPHERLLSRCTYHHVEPIMVPQPFVVCTSLVPLPQLPLPHTLLSRPIPPIQCTDEMISLTPLPSHQQSGSGSGLHRRLRGGNSYQRQQLLSVV